jgi:hypothetical protein
MKTIERGLTDVFAFQDWTRKLTSGVRHLQN